MQHGYICVSCLLSRSRVSKPKPFSFHLSSVRTVVSAESCSEKKQWALHDSDAAPRSTSKQTDKPRYSVGSNPKNAIPKTTFPGGTEEGLLAKSKRPRGYTEKLEGNNIEVRSFGVLATQLSTTQTNESNEEVPKPVQEQSRKQTPKTSKKRKAKSLKKKKTKLSAKEGATDSQKKESESSKDKTSELSNKETSKPVGKKVSKKSKKVSAPSSKEANNKAGQKSTVAPRYYLSEAPDKDLGEVGGYTTLRNALTRAPESDIQSLAARTLNVERKYEFNIK
ncbi:MAG: hypothetical protein M1837_001724 [Sclerophora amabilis]|nr:MAG: hypothetical protein M1837_001724 [Sclerophora amabilis]